MINRFLTNSSLLAREINWLETIGNVLSLPLPVKTPYSLGKLIDWKRDFCRVASRFAFFVLYSLLAREINWLETTASQLISGQISGEILLPTR